MQHKAYPNNINLAQAYIFEKKSIPLWMYFITSSDIEQSRKACPNYQRREWSIACSDL